MKRFLIIISNLLISLGCITFYYPVFAAPNAEGIQIYQKHSTPEIKQSLADDIDRYRNAENIWDVLRAEFTLPHYEDNYRVQEQIEWFMNNQDFLYRSAARAAPYLYYILQQVRIRHLPAEVALLPVIESSFNPFAYSPAGAAGIWQMMPATANGLGIKQSWWYDGRRDVVASTKAALNYLAYLGNFFDGNWLLGIAAYDTGEGNILSAIKRNSRDGISTDFWSLPVAQETQLYIPKLLALAAIISNPHKYPIQLPYVRNAPYLAQVDLGGQIDLKHAAHLAGLSIHELKQLNSGYSRSAIGPNGPFKLVLPIENVEEFTENLSISPQFQQIAWVHHKIKNGETLKVIAQKYNVSVKELKKLNPTLARNFKVGTKLTIPRTGESITNTILESTPIVEVSEKNNIQEEPVATSYSLKAGDTLYMVRRGDTLEKISRKFKIPSQYLLAINQLRQGSTLEPGKQLIIPTHAPAVKKQNNNDEYALNAGDTVYMVRHGDTIEKIARHFHTTPDDIRVTNLLASNQLKEGDQIVIPTPV